MRGLRRPSQGAWYGDTTDNGQILIYPFEYFERGRGQYAHHNDHTAINLLFFDGHVQTRDKYKQPAMFRLRQGLSGPDLVIAPYVADSGQTNPDGLWRAWLKNYPGDSGIANQAR